MTQVSAFFDAVGGILWLNRDVILGLQTAPNGLSFALAILLLATISDVLGNSPVLFIKKMRPSRLAVAFGVETVLSLIRLGIWLVAVWLLLYVVNPGAVDLASVVVVLGIGYAPMLWSFLVVIPTFGPFLGRILVAWTLVTMTASIAVARNANPWEVVVGPLVVMLVILVMYRTSNRLSVAVLGPLSRRLSGTDLMQRTRSMDPLLVISDRNGQVRRPVAGG